MNSIVPTATDRQVETRFICPVCVAPAKTASVRLEGHGAKTQVRHADCICPNEHLFIVRWNEAA